jgi:phage tail sheath protein FI
MTHVFEPNSGSFRRRVQADFEAMLGSLFTRGAFAGATPRSAYQVVTDDSINTPQSTDQGRFVVELRVAPSLPMRFLTVRLLHAADRALALVEV